MWERHIIYGGLFRENGFPAHTNISHRINIKFNVSFRHIIGRYLYIYDEHINNHIYSHVKKYSGGQKKIETTFIEMLNLF